MESGHVEPVVPSNNKNRRETGSQTGWRITGDELLKSSSSLPKMTAVKSENDEIKLEPSLSWTEFSQSQMESRCEEEAASNNSAEVRKFKTEEEECRIHPPDGSSDVNSNKFKITYSCSECCTEFKDQKSLQNHLTENASKCFNSKEKSNLKLEKTQINKCWVCRREFRTEVNLMMHMRTHETEKPFCCDECGNGFGRISDLNRHIRIHTGEKPFICCECEKRFTKGSSLKQHMIIHTGEKPFCCCECEKTFSRKSDLKKHFIVHTGAKPFSCDECGQRFGHNSNLIKHLRIHTGEKPFCCDECGKRFGRKAYLNVHMITHTGVRPFSCDYCGKRYCRKIDLDKHVRIHTESTQLLDRSVP